MPRGKKELAEQIIPKLREMTLTEEPYPSRRDGACRRGQSGSCQVVLRTIQQGAIGRSTR
jgi:hypothetical protein